MKYLNSFNESFSRKKVSEVYEFLSSIEDLTLDFKDEGFNISFGVMESESILPSGMPIFHEKLSDAHIRNILTMDCKVCLLFNFKPDRRFLLNMLKDDQKEVVCNDIESVSSFIKSESDIVSHLEFYYSILIDRKVKYGGYNIEPSYKCDLETLLSRIKDGSAIKIYITFKMNALLR